MISEDQKRRVNLPLFNDKIAVGWPSPADDYVERSIDLNEYLIKNSAATYFLRAAGDSMINVGIHNDAILIVDRSIEPTDGKIVIASVDGSYTCKRLQLYPEPRLVAENIKYPPIKIDKKEIIKSLLDSNLTGRGGAGFPTGMKWDFCSKAKGDKKYVICNADEGDSGAFSDRYLLEDQPLKVIFGMVICGYVIGSNEGVLYIRGEYPKSIEAINGCINELKKLNLLGENILGTDFSFDLGICIGQGAYICGEETALIASIEGRRAEVDVRPPFPVTEGLYKKPTVVNNVETLAAATGILLNGSEKFSSVGNKKSAGTKLVCLDSFFNNPGVYEIDMGTPMKKIFNEIGGGYKEPVKAFQIGGPLGGVVPLSEIENLNLDFQEFTAKGFMLGHASVVSIPKDFPMAEYIHHLFEFSAEESCGKCFPGRLGSYRGKEMFDQAKKKTAKIPLKLLEELLVTMQKGCLCALCGAIPTPIQNILKYFGDEMKNDMVKDN